MIVPDGAEARSGWRMPRWMLKGTVIAAGVIVVGIVLFFAFYGRVLTRAAMTERVMQENNDLKRYYYKVQLLEENLIQVRQAVNRMTSLAGIDFEFPEFPSDSELFAGMGSATGAMIRRSFTLDWTSPAGLPLKGFVTQDFKNQSSDHYHPGIDLACAIGTPVLATGSGVIQYVDYDSIYGHMVVVKHNDSVTTVYAHNSEILVPLGQQVLVGSRVALSGNSGESSAPHLHYEIRINGEPINPLDNPYEEN